MVESGLRRHLLLGNDGHADRRRILWLLLASWLCWALLAACAAGPRPEGSDFMSEDSTYSDQGSVSAPENSRADVFVSPRAKEKVFHKVAVMPFRAPVELVGASIADMAATEILKTYKYRLIERSQMQQVLQEQSLGLKGVTDSAMAMKVGKILGVEGVIVGTVPEYGMRAVGSLELPAVGINIRLIDTETGAIIWTITDSAISKKVVSLSAFTRRMVKSMIRRLAKEWVRAGDTYAVNLQPPQVVSYQGKIRSVVIKVYAGPREKFKSYTLYRSHTKKGPYEKITTRRNNGDKTIVLKDKNLLDAETYYYKIGAVNALGLHAAAEKPLHITTAGPPQPVTGLRADGGLIRMVALAWTPSRSKTVSGYALYRSDSRHGPFKQIKVFNERGRHQYVDRGKGSSYRDYGDLTDQKTYYYKIQAINVVGVHSPDSPVVSAVTAGPPEPVTDLRAAGGQIRHVTLTWTPSRRKTVAGYALYRSDSASGVYKKIKELKDRRAHRYIDRGDGASSFSDTGKLADHQAYFYKIQSINIAGVHSPDSAVATAVTRGAPPQVTGLAAKSRLARKVALSWTALDGKAIKGYLIFRSTNADGPFTKVAFVKNRRKNRYLDLGKESAWGDRGNLKDHTRYFYKIQSVNIVDVHSVDSKTATAVTKPVPAAVAGLASEQLAVKRVDLQWQPNPESDIQKYQLFRGPAAGKVTDRIANLPAKQTQYRDAPLKDGRTYCYKLRAVDKDDLQGAFSHVVCSRTKPLPRKPQGLTAKYENRQIVLQWRPNPENDILRYRVFRHGFLSWSLLGEATGVVYRYGGKIKPGEKDTFRVVAVDKDHLASPPSDEIVFRVPK